MAVENAAGLDTKFGVRRNECVSEGPVGGDCAGRRLIAAGGAGADSDLRVEACFDCEFRLERGLLTADGAGVDGDLKVEACFDSEFRAGFSTFINDILDQW
jgi:hypothetical protein